MYTCEQETKIPSKRQTVSQQETQIILQRSCCCLFAKSCLTPCHPMNCSTPGFPILYSLPEFAQNHVH